MAIIGAVFLLALYVASYALLVVPKGPGFTSGIQPWPKHPTYRVADRYSELIFRPAVALDQRWFPRRWQYWTCPDELIDAVESMMWLSPSDWEHVHANARLKTEWEKFHHAVAAATEATQKRDMITAAAHPKEAKEFEKDIQRWVNEALDAEREFRRIRSGEKDTETAGKH